MAIARFVTPLHARRSSGRWVGGNTIPGCIDPFLWFGSRSTRHLAQASTVSTDRMVHINVASTRTLPETKVRDPNVTEVMWAGFSLTILTILTIIGAGSHKYLIVMKMH